MAVSSQVETKRIRYLLGLCSQAERERIESEYFEDENAFQEMLTAENDLIDAYSRGELTGEEQTIFEKRFLTSQRARDRVQFARAFTSTQVVSPSFETRPRATLFAIFSSFREWRHALRLATTTAVIVVVAVVSWLFIQPNRMPNSELRTQNSESGPKTDAVSRIENDKPASTEKPATHPLLPRTDQSRKLKSNERQQVANRERPGPVKEPLVTVENATLGNTFETKEITQLPLEARNVPNLATLQTAATRDGYVSGKRADQSNITLDGVDITPRFYYLSPRTFYSSNIATITIANSQESIRLQLGRESAAPYTQYYAAVETGDGRPVTWLNWIELSNGRNSNLNTPEVPTSDLPSGDYVLTLTAKEPDGSIVKVAEYWFRIVRN